MSDYGNQPPDPNTPNPYGQAAPPNPYGQAPPPAYSQPGYGLPGYAAPGPPYAHWGKRVGAYLLDSIANTAASIPLYIGYAMILATAETTTTRGADGTVTTTLNDLDASPLAIMLIVLGVVAGIAFFVWNTCLRGGRTGYSLGKGVLGIKLVGERTGQPIGAGMAFLRQLAHILDSLPCNLGYLWPLWDAKRQTFADKVMSSIVIDQPKG